MLLALLAAISFVQPVSLTCGNSASAQTEAILGPDSTRAVLKVSAEDDHAKDTHLCMADYKLELTRGSEQPQSVDLMTSDNDWGRRISIQLSGFSADGKRILGIFSEGGDSPTQQVFEYNTEDGNVRLFDLRRLATAVKPEKCLVNAQVVGTMESGAVALELRSGKDCTRSSTWLLNSARGPLQRLHHHATMQALYSTSHGH